MLTELVLCRNENFTSKYYAKKVLRYLRSRRIERKWVDLISLPESQKSLLEGAVLISQWGQMEQEHLTNLSEVKEILDGIAARVTQLVGEKKNADDPKTIRKVLTCINQVLYGEIGFHGNKEDYYAHENSYIDKVN